MTKLQLTHLGHHWPWGGDLFYMTHPNGEQARVFVDDLGETWVDVRRIPKSGVFHTERVRAHRELNGADKAERELLIDGFGAKRVATHAHLVRERGI
jgi:hypothetical protein